MPEPGAVPERVRALAAKLSQAQPMRRGSLGERFLKCGKPRCACASQEEARHGPYFSLTRAREGRTHSRRLTSKQAERVRQQLAAGRAFREQVEAFWGACEEWADAELDRATAEGAEKGGSRRSSRRRSAARSKPSSAREPTRA